MFMALEAEQNYQQCISGLKLLKRIRRVYGLLRKAIRWPTDGCKLSLCIYIKVSVRRGETTKSEFGMAYMLITLS